MPEICLEDSKLFQETTDMLQIWLLLLIIIIIIIIIMIINNFGHLYKYTIKLKTIWQ